MFFAGWKRRLSLYPIPMGDAAYQEAIVPYRKAKSALHFPLNKPVPYALVERTVSFLVEEREE